MAEAPQQVRAAVRPDGFEVDRPPVGIVAQQAEHDGNRVGVDDRLGAAVREILFVDRDLFGVPLHRLDVFFEQQHVRCAVTARLSALCTIRRHDTVNDGIHVVMAALRIGIS